MSSVTSSSKCYDNTKISSYKECPRRYFIRHILHWTPHVKIALALTFGSSWHDAQDVVWGHAKKFSKNDLWELAGMAFVKTWTDAGLPEHLSLEQQNDYAPRTPAVAKEMLYNYIDQRWDMLQQINVLAIEQPCAVPLPNVENTFYVGRLDKVFEWDTGRINQRIIGEHKSTTAYATQGNFRPEYVESWSVSSQVKGYQFMGNLFYGRIDGVWVDAALVHRKVHDAFKFIPESHSFVILQEWILNTEGWVKQIVKEEEAYKEKGELLPGMFKKNEESCYGKYGACAFIDICRTIADPSKVTIPPNFVVEKWEPFDELGLAKLVKENVK